MTTYYVDPSDGTTGHDGTSGDPYSIADWQTAIQVNGSGHTYWVKLGTTYEWDSNSNFLNLDGLDNITITTDASFDAGGGTDPIIESFLEVSGSWVEVNDSGDPITVPPDSHTNKWMLSGASTAYAKKAPYYNSAERVFSNVSGTRTGLGTTNSIGTLSTTYRVYWDTAGDKLYVYSTADPSSGIDGSGTIDIPAGSFFLQVDGTDGLLVENITFKGGNGIIYETALSSSITSMVFDGVNHERGMINATPIQMCGTSTSNISGFVFRNGSLDKKLDVNEDAQLAYGNAHGIRLMGNVGPASGESLKSADGLHWYDGVHIHDSVISGHNHGAVNFDMKIADTRNADKVRIRCVLVEDLIIDNSNIGIYNGGRLCTIHGVPTEKIVYRRIDITGCGAVSHFGGNGEGENACRMYNVIFRDSGQAVIDFFTTPGGSWLDGAGTITTYVRGCIVSDITMIGGTGGFINFSTGGMQADNLPGGIAANEKIQVRNILMDEVDGLAATYSPDPERRFAIIMTQAGTTETYKNICEFVQFSNIVCYHTTNTLYVRTSDDSSLPESYLISAIEGDRSNYTDIIVTDPDINTSTGAISNTGSAYNAGYNTGIGSDYYQNPKPGAGDSLTAYDIGAVEYQDDSGGSVSSATHTYSLRRKIATL